MPIDYAPLTQNFRRTQELANSSRILEEWPYPWEQMPQEGRPFHQRNSIEVPAPGVQGLITAYQIPLGFTAVVKGLLFYYSNDSGSQFTQGSGNILYSLDVDKPLGASPIVGWPVPDYTNVATDLGSPQQGFWKIPGAIIIQTGTIRAKGTAVSTVNTGPGAYFTAAIIGWIHPSR